MESDHKWLTPILPWKNLDGRIDSYLTIGLSVPEIVDRLGRSKQPVYNVIYFLKEGKNVQDYYRHYKEKRRVEALREKNCQKIKVLFIKRKVTGNGTPDAIIGIADKELRCSRRTLYRRFKDSDVRGNDVTRYL